MTLLETQRWFARRPRFRPALAVSTLFLLAANMVPLYAVLALGWTVGAVVILFWLENLIVGLLNLLRILTASSRQLGPIEKLSKSLFFTLHYGGFWVAHGVFVFAMFTPNFQRGRQFIPGEQMADVMAGVLQPWFLAALLGIALSHLVSYIVNYLGQGEYKRLTGAQLMSLPYTRVMALHITLVLGGLFVQAMQSPVAALLILVGAKTLLDMGAHLKEHAYVIPAIKGVDGPEMHPQASGHGGGRSV